MKSTYAYAAAALVLTFGLAACIPSATPPATPAPSSPQASTPPVVVVAPDPLPPGPAISMPTISEDWADRPQTIGDWEYARESSETFAVFGNGQSEPEAIIRCDLQTRNIGIGQFGETSAGNALMMIRTETQGHTMRAIPQESGAPLHAGNFAANDPLLDAIALTRGRFALAVAGKPTLYLPVWGEVTRVIEDCR